jgi:hypothetical protein
MRTYEQLQQAVREYEMMLEEYNEPAPPPRVPAPVPNEPNAREGQPTCAKCLERAVATLIRPCRHSCLCVTCAIEVGTPANATCPMCRVAISHIEGIFLS